MGKNDKVQAQAEVKTQDGETRTVTITGDSAQDVANQLDQMSKGGDNEILDARWLPNT